MGFPPVSARSETSLVAHAIVPEARACVSVFIGGELAMNVFVQAGEDG